MGAIARSQDSAVQPLLKLCLRTNPWGSKHDIARLYERNEHIQDSNRFQRIMHRHVAPEICSMRYAAKARLAEARSCLRRSPNLSNAQPKKACRRHGAVDYLSQTKPQKWLCGVMRCCWLVNIKICSIYSVLFSVNVSSTHQSIVPRL